MKANHSESLATKDRHLRLTRQRTPVWGAQAASLQLPAACRQHFCKANRLSVFRKRAAPTRQAAESNRLAACAPQNIAIAFVESG
ncbi:MAG TPA: hypothetical protein DCO65_05375 [Spartobacteria bacterium]|nr:hypothetical protein [Spartobacteria bacterium]